MSIYRAQLRNSSTALSPRVFSEQIRPQVPPKLFGGDSWIPQTIGQWIPDCWSGYRKSTGPKAAASNSWNQQLITSGRSQMLATRNCRDWHAIFGEVTWSPVLKTTMDCHSELVLHSLRNNQPMHQRRQTALIFPGPCDQTCTTSLKWRRTMVTRNNGDKVCSITVSISLFSSISLYWRWGFDKPSQSTSISSQNCYCC